MAITPSFNRNTEQTHYNNEILPNTKTDVLQESVGYIGHQVSKTNPFKALANLFFKVIDFLKNPTQSSKNIKATQLDTNATPSTQAVDTLKSNLSSVSGSSYTTQKSGLAPDSAVYAAIDSSDAKALAIAKTRFKKLGSQITAIKISRQDPNNQGLTHSYVAIREGKDQFKVLRQFHNKDHQIAWGNGKQLEIRGNRQFIKGTTKSAGFLGEGGVKVASRLVDVQSETTTHVRGVKKDDIGSLKKSITVQKKLKRLDKGNKLCLGHVLEYTTSKGVKKEVFVPEFMDKNMQDLQQKLPLKVLTRALTQLAEGVQFIHENDHVHLDLKPGNFEVNYNPKTGEINAKVGDFDFATYHRGPDSSFRVGTPGYAAPELSDANQTINYPKKADVYSFGMAMLVIEYGEGKVTNFILDLQDLPGKPDSEAISQLAKKHGFNTTPLDNLIPRLLVSNPRKRPNMDEVAAELRQIHNNLD